MSGMIETGDEQKSANASSITTYVSYFFAISNKETSCSFGYTFPVGLFGWQKKRTSASFNADSILLMSISHCSRSDKTKEDTSHPNASHAFRYSENAGSTIITR